MERVAEIVRPQEEPAEVAVAPLHAVDPRAALELLLEQAASPEADRAAIAGRINFQLAVLAEQHKSKQTAELLHRLLDERTLDGLRDPSGLSSRAAAVRALIDLGFPHALEVAPEDLELLRRELSPRRFRKVLALAIAVATAVGLLLAGWLLGGG